MGKILTAGFDVAESEKAIVSNIIQDYDKKISREIEYEEIVIRLRKTQHGKAFMHEVQAKLEGKKIFNAKVTDYNLFYAVAEALEKILNEVKHHNKKIHNNI